MLEEYYIELWVAAGPAITVSNFDTNF